jgi:murein tripeptide amidase MpaA
MSENEIVVDFDHYHDYGEMTGLLKAYSEAYPGLTSLESIGESLEGRELWMLVITNQETGEAGIKPGMWIDGNTHSGEVTGCEVCLYTINHLLTTYGEDPLTTKLLDEKAIYIVPRIDPDGAELYLKSPYNRTGGARYYPLSEDEWREEKGLYPEDVNGDDVITKMRIKTPNGDWKISEKDPRIMVKRGVDEEDGTFYRLYPEGMLLNYDGGEITMAPTRMGLNLNREWPANWEPHPIQPGAGPYPLSQPETRAVADAWNKHTNLGGIMTYHTTSGAILRPFNTEPDEAFAKNDCAGDLATYKALGGIGEELTGYPLVSIWHDFLLDKRSPRHGNSKDWWYMHWGVFIYCIELWDMIQQAGLPGIKERGFDFRLEPPEDAQVKLLEWNDDELDGEGFMEWTPYDHPQLGRVEIGGWRDKYTWRNPPVKLLEEECRRTYRFALKLAEALPLLRIRKIHQQRIGEDLYRLEVEVANEGFLPTNISEQALKMKKAKTVKAKIELGEGLELVLGEGLTNLVHIEGRSDRLPGEPFYSVSGGKDEESVRRLSWTLRVDSTDLPSTVDIVIGSEKAGTIRERVEIK